MSIKSNAFGRVTLTDDDATKFHAQVKYGRPKAAAIESVRKGVEMAKCLEQSGKVRLVIKRDKRVIAVEG